MLTSLASGCVLPESSHPPDYANLSFLGQALAAKADRREALWRANRDGDGSDAGELRAALLQSLPDHSGYDLVTAKRRLTALLARKPHEDVASVARLRLAELHADEDCRAELVGLRERVAQLIDLEQGLPAKSDHP